MRHSDEKIVIKKELLSQQLDTANSSSLEKYQQKVLGNKNIGLLLKYELVTTLFGNFSGGLGYLLRKHFYPGILKHVGAGAIFGKGIVIRHGRKIYLGSRVAIDDYVMLDASGSTGETNIEIRDDVIISRNCVIQAKTGPVIIREKTDIGCNVIASSAAGIDIGRSVLIAGNCYIGGGRYFSDRTDIPIMEQGNYSKGPVMIGDGVWLGAGAIVLDGVSIGKGCIVGAGAVVTSNLAEFTIAVGVPAHVLKKRNSHDDIRKMKL